MSEYTKQLTAEQLIEYIARDYVELSHEKVLLQRNDHINICREWLEHNIKYPPDDGALSDDQVSQLVANFKEPNELDKKENRKTIKSSLGYSRVGMWGRK